MKKVMYTVVLVVAANVVYAQGFLKKVKAKVTQAIAQPVVNQVPAGMGSGTITNTKWSDPATCGTVVKTFNSKEIANHMGGFDIWFPYVRVVNNQLQLQVADYSTVLYDYANGKLVPAGTPPNVDRNALKNGNEHELISINFTVLDQTNAMVKKGPHISSGMIPGKPMQTLTFKGKPVGSFMIYQIAHNADSSVVAVAGASISGGLKYSLVSSAGQTLQLPAKAGAAPLISPDGKFSAAWIPQDDQAYISNGTIVKTTNSFPDKLWLRNTGNIFSIVDEHNSTLYKNGVVYHAFDLRITPQDIFISKDDKSMCWAGDHGLYFSDGTTFENGSSPHKVIIDGKEVMVFLTVNMTSGQVYLCKKEL